MSRFDWLVRVVKNSLDSCLQCGSIRTHQKWWQQNIAFTWRSFVSCLYPIAGGTVLENLIIIKLWSLEFTGAGAYIIQILQELEVEPALLKIKGLEEFQTES